MAAKLFKINEMELEVIQDILVMSSARQFIDVLLFRFG